MLFCSNRVGRAYNTGPCSRLVVSINTLYYHFAQSVSVPTLISSQSQPDCYRTARFSSVIKQANSTTFDHQTPSALISSQSQPDCYRPARLSLFLLSIIQSPNPQSNAPGITPSIKPITQAMDPEAAAVHDIQSVQNVKSVKIAQSVPTV